MFQSFYKSHLIDNLFCLSFKGIQLVYLEFILTICVLMFHLIRKSFTGYLNNTVIKLPIYLFRTCLLSNKLSSSFLCDFMYSYRTVVHTNIKYSYLFLNIYFFLYGKILKTTILSTLTFCNVSSYGEVVYKECWWNWHKLVIDILTILSAFYFLKLLILKCH